MLQLRHQPTTARIASTRSPPQRSLRHATVQTQPRVCTTQRTSTTTTISRPIQRQPALALDSSSRAAAAVCRASGRLIGGSDVVTEYSEVLTKEVHELADELRDFVPAKADEVLSKQEQQTIKEYIGRRIDLLLLEVDAEVVEFVQSLKDWSLKWLQDDGRVLLGLSAQPAGEYFEQEAIRFYVPQADDSGSKTSSSSYSSGGSGEDFKEWRDLPRHNLAPGDVVLLTLGKKGPLVGRAWAPDMLCGVVIERSKTWVKVAFDAAPDRSELESETWRLDKSVNTLTFQRALLALAALWHRMPLQEDTWLTTLKKWFGSASNSSPTFKTDVTEWYEEREHAGTFEGSALSGVIMSADKEFDWSSLPAASGGMPDSAICRFRKVLPAAGRPDAAATAALLKQMEQGGQLGYTGLLDASQMAAIATAILKPLALLHGPPGTGKTTTICGLLYFLRREHGYKGRILATSQSNVGVDNMLETCMRKGKLRVLRIGEPVKVRSSLQAFTLKAQEAKAVAADPGIAEARREQQALRKRLRNSRRKRGEYLDSSERYEIFQRLDELNEEVGKATKEIRKALLDAADVVGVTCTGAAGPELRDFAFDMVVIDEGSQAAEPEALIPIMKGSQRVVIVGDHKQLPPVIKSREAEAGGLSMSLFERLMKLGAPSAMLQVQYRSHPSLMTFINEEFYNSLLSNGVSAAARPTPAGFPFPNANVPIVFIHVDGKESSRARGSKMNEQEAAAIEACVDLFTQRCGLLPGQLGVITPYAAQVSLLSRRLQQRGISINGSSRSSSWDSVDDDFVASDLEIKYVDGYQGREKDVILLSTVRANANNEVGFLEDWRRANVALSRARTALVVVGHKGTLSSSKTWRAFLKHVDQHSCHLELKELRALVPMVNNDGGGRKRRR